MLLALAAPALGAEPATAVLACVDYDAKRAEVKYDPDKVKPEALAKAVSDAGYPARVAP